MSYNPNTIVLRHRAKALKISIAAIVAVVVLVMWAVVGVSIYFSRETALAAMQSNAGNLAFAFDDEVTHILDNVAATMDAVANRMRAQGSDMDIYKWSYEIPITTGPIIEGSIIAPDGMLISGTKAPDLKPIDMGDREHIRIQLDGKFKGLFIGKPVKARTYDQMVIPITKRVETKDGRFVGIVVFLLSPPDQLTTLHKSINLGQTGTIALVGMDDIIRARFSKNSPDGLDGIGQSIAHSNVPDGFSTEVQGFYIRMSVVDHIKRLFSFVRVADYPLVVTVGLGYDEGLASWRTNAKMILAVAAAATLLLGGLTLYLMHVIDRRTMLIIELAEKSDKLQAANIDLTEERSKLQVANTELIKSQENAETANLAKTSFLANMSHELRTPLNAIIGFSQIIKNEIMGPARPVYAEYAKDICGAGEHLLEVINNLLDISKIEAGKTELKDEFLDPAEIVDASLEALRVQAAAKRIALIADIPSGMPFIRGDSLRLRQAMINLVSNAVKFTEAGHVTVSVAFDAARGFRFTVADTGIGMSPAEIVVALEPFGQIETTYTKKNEGSGLGLPLAQRLVELHGGRLEIESVKEAGTTISIYLPLDRVVHPVPGVAA